jgi:hypothetical protein
MKKIIILLVILSSFIGINNAYAESLIIRYNGREFLFNFSLSNGESKIMDSQYSIDG